MKLDTQDVEAGETTSYKSNTVTFTPVELSHGSVSNQASMYQASVETADLRTKTFCCDFLFVLFLFVSTMFLILFWYDHIPALNAHFKAHPHDKEVVLALSCVVIGMALIVFLFRCASRSTRCHEKLRGKRKDFYNRFKTDSDSVDGKQNLGVVNDVVPDNNWNPKLSELPESDLEDVRRILRSFLDFHDDKDWLFSPSSVSAISRRGGFTENNLFRQVKESVKIKFSVKLILVGQPNVGKTSIFHRILYDRFSEYYMATLGCDLAHVSLHLYPGRPDDHVMISLQLWDIAGSERFSELSHIVYKDATAFIVICDITNQNYMTQATPWVKDITRLKYEPYVALLFNKIDLTEEQKPVTVATVEQSDIDEEMRRLDSYPVSAKTGEKVLENVIQVLVNSILHEINKLL